MTQEQARICYVELVTLLWPTWQSSGVVDENVKNNKSDNDDEEEDTTDDDEDDDGDSDTDDDEEDHNHNHKHNHDGTHPKFGPVVSRMRIGGHDHHNNHNPQPTISILQTAVQNNDLPGLQKLLQLSFSSASQTNSEKVSLLHWAADRGHVDCAALLIAAGAPVNAQDEDGQTPLHYGRGEKKKRAFNSLLSPPKLPCVVMER